MLQEFPSSRPPRTSIGRVLFWLIALIASALHWIPHFPPQIDLAQHAAQMRLLHDWLQPGFQFHEILELNLFTPYLPAYTIGALLTYVMSAVAAAKLVWSIGAFGTVYATVRIRRKLGGNEDWDWLLIPGLFGMTFVYGFLTFQFAVPLGLLALEYWIGYLKSPSAQRGAIFGAILIGLFFSHVLVTAWVMSVCGLMLLTQWLKTPRNLQTLFVHGAPLITPLPIVLAWFQKTSGYAQSAKPTQWVGNIIYRVATFFPEWLGIEGSRFAIVVGAAIIYAVVLDGARLDRDRTRSMPLLVTILVLLFAPFDLFGNSYTYDRFFTLFGPSLVIALCNDRRVTAPLTGVRHYVRVLACGWTFLWATKMFAFATEQKDFVRLLASMEPGRYVLSVVPDSRSEALGIRELYLHFPVWYQVERGGLVQFSFAAYYPTMMRFRANYPFTIMTAAELKSMLNADTLKRMNAHYIVERTGSAFLMPSDVATLRRTEGRWRLYEVSSKH